MQKKKAAKLGGFVGALCASGALIGLSVTGTGAYFTDSHNGSINASTGHVRVNTSSLTLNFTNLLPGEYQTNNVDYTADGTGLEDIWLVLPDDGSAKMIHGPSGDSYGRYAHVAVSAPDGDFSSYNVRANPNTTNPNPADSCTVDANGHGGSNQQATSTNDQDPGSYVPYCTVPGAILLSHNLAAGQGGTAKITFGFNKISKSGQDLPLAQVAAFKIVATQAGIRPDDVNNP